MVTGNCGVSLAPLTGREPPPPLNLLGGEDWYRFPTFAAYREEVEGVPPALNVAMQVGHTALRACVMDRFDRAATEDEIERMADLAEEAMRAGVHRLQHRARLPAGASHPHRGGHRARAPGRRPRRDALDAHARRGGRSARVGARDPPHRPRGRGAGRHLPPQVCRPRQLGREPRHPRPHRGCAGGAGGGPRRLPLRSGLDGAAHGDRRPVGEGPRLLVRAASRGGRAPARRCCARVGVRAGRGGGALAAGGRDLLHDGRGGPHPHPRISGGHESDPTACPTMSFHTRACGAPSRACWAAIAATRASSGSKTPCSG